MPLLFHVSRSYNIMLICLFIYEVLTLFLCIHVSSREPLFRHGTATKAKYSIKVAYNSATLCLPCAHFMDFTMGEIWN